MDWAKAKNILILMLLALNLLLAAILINRMAGGADRALYTSVTNIMCDRGVSVDCEFPKKITDSSLLIYGDGARYVENCAKILVINGGSAARIEMLGRESLKYFNPDPYEALSVVSATALDTALRKMFTEWGISLTGFITDFSAKTEDGGYYFKYIFAYAGNLVFDNNIDVTVNKDGGISGVTINYREIKSASNDNLMKVIPAYQVILKNYYVSGDVITSINIGFMGQNTARDNPFVESEEGAVWRVKLDDGSERFFEATYGDEIFRPAQTNESG
jgi:hypothetical protein